ncbi:hypothetical protein, partial [Mesorhizobium sp. M7A.F.Ca.CA.001.05.1.1]|uniref:hypothetical protein n=1 Tax=Mesorhizobium sp. M7A.F.Ca.CA.001.05.1.1 TaxID=2496721 RepID=UPI0019CF56F9
TEMKSVADSVTRYVAERMSTTTSSRSAKAFLTSRMASDSFFDWSMVFSPASFIGVCLVGLVNTGLTQPPAKCTGEIDGVGMLRRVVVREKVSLLLRRISGGAAWRGGWCCGE